MGMNYYDALVLLEVAKRLPRKARVLTLGVPTLNFSPSQIAGELRKLDTDAQGTDFSSAAQFFRLLGFEEVDALDISDYEGANIVGDLNDPQLAERVGKRYDLVYDSGTIEHIFDVIGALRTIHSLVDVGGAVVHATPANGFVDHGFWQISPDLFRAFYAGAGYELLTSAFLVFGPRPYALPAIENVYRNRGRSFIVETLPEAIAVFAALKSRDVPATTIKLQEYYGMMHEKAGKQTAIAFYLPFGSPVLGRLSRNHSMAWLINMAARVRSALRRMS
jgi:hypothetical protein